PRRGARGGCRRAAPEDSRRLPRPGRGGGPGLLTPPPPPLTLPGTMADRHPPTEHYFSAEPAVVTRPRNVNVRLPDQSIELRTDRGVFSLAGLDPGTAVLLQGVPAPPAGATLLDLGCGHGVVAIAMARRAPQARVIAVDVNNRALELTRANATANGVERIEVCRPDEVDRG